MRKSKILHAFFALLAFLLIAVGVFLDGTDAKEYSPLLIMGGAILAWFVSKNFTGYIFQQGGAARGAPVIQETKHLRGRRLGRLGSLLIVIFGSLSILQLLTVDRSNPHWMIEVFILWGGVSVGVVLALISAIMNRNSRRDGIF